MVRAPAVCLINRNSSVLSAFFRRSLAALLGNLAASGMAIKRSGAEAGGRLWRRAPVRAVDFSGHDIAGVCTRRLGRNHSSPFTHEVLQENKFSSHDPHQDCDSRANEACFASATPVQRGPGAGSRTGGGSFAWPVSGLHDGATAAPAHAGSQSVVLRGS
jgi:hypothetical protein